jgi:ankyrin repeat protein
MPRPASVAGSGGEQGIPWTPPINAPQLAVAAYEGDVETVRTLIEQGANVNEPAAEDYYPFTIACSVALGGGAASAKNVHRKCAELLARAGADVNLPLHDGRTALMTAGTTKSITSSLTNRFYR